MKIRIGVALGAAGTAEGFTAAVRRLEDLEVDSLWLSEMVFGPLIEPFIGWAHALARTTRLKVGTGVAILPGRHPVLVAKQLASLARLAPGRVLPAFGLHAARPAERSLFPVPPGRRGEVFDESLALMRLLLRQEYVTFSGDFFSVEHATIGTPTARPLDIWLGGSGPAALRRVGRFGDGWLASFLTPDEAGSGREAIEAAAATADRKIDDDHFGVNLSVAPHGASAETIAALRQRRPGVDLTDLVPADWAVTRARINRFIEAGITKFVIRPAQDMALDDFLNAFVRELAPLET